MKKVNVLTAALMTVALSVVGIAQSSDSRFSLRLEMQDQTAHLGSKIRGFLVLTNTTDHAVEVYSDRGGSAYSSGYTIDVRDASGRSPESTTETLPIAAYPATRTLKPGESIKYTLDINELYRITNAGEYSVQAKILDSTQKHFLTSNTAQVTVTK